MAVSAVLRVRARSKGTAFWVGFGENGWFAFSTCITCLASNFINCKRIIMKLWEPTQCHFFYLNLEFHGHRSSNERVRAENGRWFWRALSLRQFARNDSQPTQLAPHAHAQSRSRPSCCGVMVRLMLCSPRQHACTMPAVPDHMGHNCKADEDTNKCTASVEILEQSSGRVCRVCSYDGSNK